MPKRSVPLSKSNKSGKPSKAKRESEKTKKKKKKKQPSKPRSQRVVKKKKPYSYRLNAFDPKQPNQLPETDLTKKGYTLRKLIRSTPRLMINNAGNVVLKKVKKVKTRSGMPAVRAETYSTDPFRPDKVLRLHTTIIIGLDTNKDDNPDVKKPVNAHKKVLVSCDCESFVYTFEYANAAHGASRIIYSNGNPPVVTNPGLEPGLCKHLVRLSNSIIKSNM